jgi:ATP-dependent helicase HrpA
VRAHAAARVLAVVEAVEPVLALRGQVRRAIVALESGLAAPRTAAARADVRAQVDGLLRPGFVAASGVERLPDLQRYLRAALHRLERAATTAREPVLQESIDRVEGAYADLLDALPAQRRAAREVTDIAWAIEELRVSLFAQALGTAHPVSEKRVLAAIAGVDGNPRGVPAR